MAQRSVIFYVKHGQPDQPLQAVQIATDRAKRAIAERREQKISKRRRSEYQQALQSKQEHLGG